MRFTIEQRHLTNPSGKPVRDANAVEIHAVDADSVDDAIRMFIRHEQAEIIGDVLTFPGFQAVATVRGTSGVYTLQVSPASGRYVVC